MTTILGCVCAACVLGYLAGLRQGRASGRAETLSAMLTEERRQRAALSVLFEAKARQGERSSVGEARTAGSAGIFDTGDET